MFSVTETETVDIIVISLTHEAKAIREVLEALGFQVRMHYIGNVNYFISLFKEKTYLHKTVILCCHGDEEGLHIPQLAESLEHTMPYHGKLTPQNINEIVRVQGRTVINTGCCLGSGSFAQSFLSQGATNYIGAQDYIEADAILMFVVNFFYFIKNKEMTLKACFQAARGKDKERESLRLWQKANF